MRLLMGRRVAAGAGGLSTVVLGLAWHLAHHQNLLQGFLHILIHLTLKARGRFTPMKEQSKSETLTTRDHPATCLLTFNDDLPSLLSDTHDTNISRPSWAQPENRDMGPSSSGAHHKQEGS